jgi:hypothetical protein
VIVVVEGPSAAGKTTWCTTLGSASVVAETGPLELPAASSDDDLAQFWSEVNCRRWAEAVRVESEYGLAVCDTDPLKLHYDYCLARIGIASWERFEAGVAIAAEAIALGQLGLADVVMVDVPDDETLARHRRSDPTRSRRNFDLHRRLGPGLRDWYGALAQLDPDRVIWEYPDEMPPAVARDRHDVDLFEAWMAQLRRHRTSA